MHTSIQHKHTVQRDGRLYYNRRVPAHAREAYGNFIRVRIDDPTVAAHLTKRLDAIWEAETVPTAVSIAQLVAASYRRKSKLSEMAKEYMDIKAIQTNPTLSSAAMLIALSGDMEVAEYTRQDARHFVASLIASGNRTSTVRRRMNCLTAIFNYAYAEYEVPGRNPFSRVLIPKEGSDKQARVPFGHAELVQTYISALQSGRRIRYLVPILGETGCRIAEIVGLRKEDIAGDAASIKIVGHSTRRLKTAGSERDIPLVGYARIGIKCLLGTSNSNFLFPEYQRGGLTFATHASNTLNKWLKKQTAGKTAHCLRHAFRDRLREVECPLELIDALGGWSSVQGAGRQYGYGYKISQKREWLERIAIRVEQNL